MTSVLVLALVLTCVGAALFIALPRHRRRGARELICVPYDRADRLLRENVGWRLAPEEDSNRLIGMVYLERDAQTVKSAQEQL